MDHLETISVFDFSGTNFNTQLLQQNMETAFGEHQGTSLTGCVIFLSPKQYLGVCALLYDCAICGFLMTVTVVSSKRVFYHVIDIT